MAGLTGERVLREAGSAGKLHFVLTTHRVRLEEQSIGRGTLVSIMLEEVASCTIAQRSNPLILVVGAIIAFFGLFYTSQTQASDGLFIGLIAGGICALIYFRTRRMVLEVGSASANLRLDIASMRFEAVKEIIDAIEEAKHVRYLLLSATHLTV